MSIYPGLSAHDNTVTGSIVIEGSRLPLWAIVTMALTDGWAAVEENWPQVREYGYGAKDLAALLYRLLQQRGAIAHLLLALADVERRSEPDLDACGGWWNVPEHNQRVRKHLEHCLVALEQCLARIRGGTEMTSALVVDLSLPPAQLSPNGRVHWAEKARAARGYRSACCWQTRVVTRACAWQPPERARLSLTFAVRNRRGRGVYAPRDRDNALAAAKALIDGLVDGGALLADDAQHLVLGDVAIDFQHGPYVRATIEAEEMAG